ncbi:hypothetical protein Tco_0917130 [Tanacetum coccineum]
MVINSPCLTDKKELAIPGQMTTGKEFLNPLMADRKSKEVGTRRYLSLVVPLTKVGDEAVHKELGDRIERAVTTASSFKTEQDSGGYTPGSDEGIKKLNELTELCTKLSEKVKHLEDQLKSTTKRRKAKVVISDEEEDLVSEDHSKQGRMLETKYEDVETEHAEEVEYGDILQQITPSKGPHGEEQSQESYEVHLDVLSAAKILADAYHQGQRRHNPTKDMEKALWVELKRLFDPDKDDVLWKLQNICMIL